MNMIKNLLFDLGGVVMDIKRTEAVKAFEELGMKDADSFFDAYHQTGAFGLLEGGQITAAEFRAAVRPSFRPGVTDGEIDRALCRFLIGIPVERLQRLEALRNAGYGVYMLSNTNPIMWHASIIPEFGKEGKTLDAYFDGCVTSFEAGVCKPDERIYDYACRQLGIKASETVFFDDGQANVDAAVAYGMNAELVTEGCDMLQLTSRYL